MGFCAGCGAQMEDDLVDFDVCSDCLAGEVNGMALDSDSGMGDDLSSGSTQEGLDDFSGDIKESTYKFVAYNHCEQYHNPSMFLDSYEELEEGLY